MHRAVRFAVVAALAGASCKKPGFETAEAAPQGPALVSDDPNRPTGAPIPALPPKPPENTSPKRSDGSFCPAGTWTSMAGWTWKAKARLCSAAAELVPRCSTAEVWKRAKAKRAPGNAIAVLDLLRLDDGTQSWLFSITDELRKVDIDLELKDNCAAVVERP